MPFERYLQQQQPPPPLSHRPHRHPPTPENAAFHDALGFQHDPATFSANVQFQVPHLMLGPTLAPGGGAEVLPAGMLGNASALAAPWFNNLGFPREQDQRCVVLRRFLSSVLIAAAVMPIITTTTRRRSRATAAAQAATAAHSLLSLTRPRTISPPTTTPSQSLLTSPTRPPSSLTRPPPRPRRPLTRRPIPQHRRRPRCLRPLLSVCPSTLRQASTSFLSSPASRPDQTPRSYSAP